MEPVRSRRNPRIAAAGRLRRARDRASSGRTLLEGPHLLHEAIEAGVVVVEVFCLEADDVTIGLCDQNGLFPTLVTPEVLDAVADTESPRGPVAVIEVPQLSHASSRRDLLWADLSDPGNAGSVIRTGAAFGLDVVIPIGRVDPWSPKSVRSGAGAHFRTSIRREMPVDVGRLATVPRYGVSVDRLVDLLDPDRRWAVMVGSEAHGLGEDLVKSAEAQVTIPMPGGTESLNAAAAAAIVAYELARWREACR